MRKSLLIAGSLLALLIMSSVSVLTLEVTAQSGTRVVPPAFHDRLWSWLTKVNYRKWPSPTGKAPELVPSEGPHGAFIKLYIQSTAVAEPGREPEVALLVKESYDQDKKLSAITVMQRAKGYDPEHGDWFYAKYAPDGSIATMPMGAKRVPVAGKVTMCIECHRDAGGGDFTFFND